MNRHVPDAMQVALADMKRAAKFWERRISEEAQRKAKHAHGITRVGLAKVSGKHLSAAANEPEPCDCGSVLVPELTGIDRKLADSFAGEKPFPLKDEK